MSHRMSTDVVLYGVHPGHSLVVARGDHVESSGTAVGVGDGYCLTAKNFSNVFLRQ